MVVDFQSFRGGTAVFHLNRFTNSASGVTVSLASTGQSPALRGADGKSLPYVVRFAGQDVRFTDGEAQLAAATGRDQGDGSDDELEIVAPAIAVTAGQPLADQLVLVVTAR